MEETHTAAYCVRCSRTGHVTAQPDGYWCGWCGDGTDIELRNVEVVTRETADRFTVDGVTVDPENAPLQPLRITEGWTVRYNNGLYEVDATEKTIAWWWIFKCDMLMLVHEQRNRLLDLGWTPEMEWDEGAYRLRLYEGDFQGRELHAYEGRDRGALVREIERILADVSRGVL